MSISKRTQQFVGGLSLAVLLLVLGVSLYEYRDYQQTQALHAKQVGKAMVGELVELFEQLRVSLQLYARAESDLLDAIRNTPEVTALHARLQEGVANYFPDHIAVGLVSADGQRLIAGKTIDPQCRTDIHNFVAQPHVNAVTLHASPAGDHFDLMVPRMPDLRPAEILFMSFKPDLIVRRLASHPLQRQQWMLVAREPAGKIELTADSIRSHVQPMLKLSAEQQSQQLFEEAVPGTKWDLLILPEADLFLSYRRQLTAKALGVLGLYGLAAFVMLWHLRRQESARSCAEQALRSANQNLEHRVVERTENLRETVTCLEQEIQARQKAQRALRNSERLFRALTEDSVDIIAIVDERGELSYVSPSASRILGYTQNELRQRPLGQFIHQRDMRRAVNNLRLALRCAGAPVWAELRVRGKTGGWRVLETSFKAISLDASTPVVVINARDVTERHKHEAQRQQLSSAVEQTADLIMITNRQGIIEYVNPAFSLVTGYHRQEVLGARPSILRSGVMSLEFYRTMWQTILSGQSFSDILINRNKSGKLYYEEKTITPLKNRLGEITHFVSTGKDITERMEAQEQLQHLAHHDVLTGLPNRALMRDRLIQAIQRARRGAHNVALLFMDLDNFKVINDTLGHEIGDLLLQDVARRLQICLRDKDTIARLGGDEFVVILEDLNGSAEVCRVAQKLIDSLATPFSLKRNELYVTTSIGITLYPADGDKLDTLISNADAAMYRAKACGGNRYEFFTPEMATKISARLALEGDLRRAHQNTEWRLHYQPRVQLTTGRVVSVEALLRWQQADSHLISPGEFIDSLEQTGLIVPVGEWVLKQVCEDLRAWQQAGLSDLRVSINLSARQLRDPNLIRSIERMLSEHKVAYSALEFEITEGSLLEDMRDSVAVLLRLRKKGCSIAVDDFGTGYSSLSYLRRLPIDRVKIDQSFVAALPKPEDAAITRTIIELAHSLGLKVTAEGVETDRQLGVLRGYGCDQAQGYLFAKPLSAAALGAWLTRDNGVVTPIRA